MRNRSRLLLLLKKLHCSLRSPLLLLLLLSLFFCLSVSYDSRDPNGNITVLWDVMQWTPDGYIVLVNISNYQAYRPVPEPGWKLSWTWAGGEVIWAAVGAETTAQGDCSRFKGNIPHSCDRRPTVVDLTANAPLNQQIYGCCRRRVLAPRGQDLIKSTAGFQLSVGNAGTTNRTVRLPKNITFLAPRGGYTCGRVKVVAPTKFVTPDGKRVTQALMTWQVVCTYSGFLANKVPPCCLSLSSFDRRMHASCNNCACCGNASMGCTKKEGKDKSAGLPLDVKCSNHMCPISINWHLASKEKDRWGATVSITNYKYHNNYTDWTLLLQLPPSNLLTQLHHANHKPISPSDGLEMFYGMKGYNNVVRSTGLKGSTVSWEVQYKEVGSKNNSKGDPYVPQVVYFNGDPCELPATSKLV